MKADELLESLSALDDELLLRSEKETRARPVYLKKWLGAAACVAMIIAAGLPVILDKTNDVITPDSTLPVTDDDPRDFPELPDDTEKAPGDSIIADDPIGTERAYEMHFNDISHIALLSSDRARLNLCDEELSPDILSLAAPRLTAQLQSAEIYGNALFHADGSPYGINLTIKLNGETVYVKLRDHPEDFYSCCIPPGEDIEETVIKDAEFSVFYRKENILSHMWAEFELDGTYFMAECYAPDDYDSDDDADELLYNVICGYALKDTPAPDLSSLSPREPWEYVDEKLTASDALSDPSFGAYLPGSLPEGFYAESIRRYKDRDSDSLSALWCRGYDDISWNVRRYSDEDAKRVTSVADTENYDLSLYPIPRAQSVPVELREIVDDPVFLIEELTLDAVLSRAYKINDAGDSDGYRMNFSVKYGDIIVKISAKGAAPEWVYSELKKLG